MTVAGRPSSPRGITSPRTVPSWRCWKTFPGRNQPLPPEGVLRDLVMTKMGPGDRDEFDVMTRLGADLPGAVFIVPETDIPASAGPLDHGRSMALVSARN
ncbi:hypothetical protein CFBP7129_27160 (plasmid) [Agrobacterium tumefaciens]|uniref:Uncharacterized protein n=1 Tax=Agrobacterium tumefaciens TaxID=358 RepID=A0A4D7Z5R7_AGRTU|nr:HipA N-terminal domain-containing protein [Agrobacterium tumefaciens]QCL97863.1 hypothetical protein CFBP7129_27160 [Agrobacterium tumefaciens]